MILVDKNFVKKLVGHMSVSALRTWTQIDSAVVRSFSDASAWATSGEIPETTIDPLAVRQMAEVAFSIGVLISASEGRNISEDVRSVLRSRGGEVTEESVLQSLAPTAYPVVLSLTIHFLATLTRPGVAYDLQLKPVDPNTKVSPSGVRVEGNKLVFMIDIFPDPGEEVRRVIESLASIVSGVECELRIGSSKIVVPNKKLVLPRGGKPNVNEGGVGKEKRI